MQAIPKIMVFSRRQIQPSSNTKICVGAHAEIGAVDVWMGAVRMRKVRLPEEFFYLRIMLRERIDSHGARNGGETLHSDAQLIQQPSCGHLTISVGVGQPTALRWSVITLERYLCSQAPRSPHPSGVGTDHNAGAAQ